MSVTKYKGKSNFGQVKNSPVMEWRWTRSGGVAEQIFHQGNYFFLRDVIAPTLVNDYDSIVIQQVSGGMYRLIAAQAGDELTEIHDVDGSNLTQNTLTNLRVKSQFITATPVVAEADYVAMVVRIQSEVNKFRSGQQTYSEMSSQVATIGGNRQCAFDLMDNLAKWGDQFLNAQYCYRHTISVSERMSNYGSVIPGLYNNTHVIFTESQLRSAENIPDTFELPQQVIDNSLPAKWLKQPARSRHVIGQRREYVLEYLFADEWDEFKYNPIE